MLAVQIPPETTVIARAFLFAWSQVMQAMVLMNEKDKKQVIELFKTLEAEAMCPEGRALDKALMTYLTHKCDAPERVGSEAPKGRA